MTRFAALLAHLALSQPTLAADPKPLWQLDLSEGKKERIEIQGIGFTPDGASLAVHTSHRVSGERFSTRYRDFLTLWSLDTKKVHVRIDLGASAGVLPFSRPTFVFPSRDTVLATSDTLGHYSLDDGKPFMKPTNHNKATRGIWLLPGGRVCTISTDLNGFGGATLDRLTVGKIEAAAEGRDAKFTDSTVPSIPLPKGKNGGFVFCVAVSPDGTQMAISFDNDDNNKHTLMLVQVEVGEKITLMKLAEVERPHLGYITAMQFSPDSKTLATGSEDGSVKWWDTSRKPVAAWAPLGTLQVSRFGVWSFAFRGDGKVLAYGTSVKTQPSIGIVDMATAKVIRTLSTESEAVAVAFSPNDTRLAVGCFRGKVQLWDVANLEGGGICDEFGQ